MKKIRATVLRSLTIEPKTHPRGLSFISAGSGIVCQNDRVYVVCDDELHLAVFSDSYAPGQLHRLLAGHLPNSVKARKAVKPDFEVLFSYHAAASALCPRIIALGSGSRPNRQTGCVVQLNVNGEPAADIGVFDLSSVYGPLKQQLGAINIEGAMIVGDEWVLINRGIDQQTDNATAHYPLALLDATINSTSSALNQLDFAPTRIVRYSLGKLGHVPLSFTDGAALPDGSWLFTAVAEDTRSSYDDGQCKGSVIGKINQTGRLLWKRRVDGVNKIEGIALCYQDEARQQPLRACLVTDADDPSVASVLALVTIDV
jgi:hypothetical protein